MGKKSKAPKLPETCLDVPQVTSLAGVEVTPIYDTHTHLHSTFEAYREEYPESRYTTIPEFVKGYYNRTTEQSEGLPAIHVPVKSLVDVWCEAPIRNEWRALADSALTPESRAENWGDIEYHFVMGVHPHEAKNYDDEVEAELLEAMKHPRNVGLGEIGLDYHYNNSPKETQKDVLVRQIKHAVDLGKPLTIHTREADDDIWEILSNNVPKDWKIHIHCFTDSPVLAKKLLDHFPNLYIGITGVITYSTNKNTAAVVRILATSPPVDPSRSPLRILLETDAPYMVPANLTKHQQQTMGLKSNARMPLCHAGMIPWTAEFVASTANQAVVDQVVQEVENGGAKEAENAPEVSEKKVWTAAEVMRIARENAKYVYGV
ncbi:TatD DNase family protein [Rhizoctonia solani AG-1 IB]|uniref:TatD DNase family protein n=1 Tax=Thanatephorus cucumeris (strain AG1-IB / isolate 7/3/14) TaxID=1108050 RepID=M5BYP2_THACB|nr:TatD DNase family protein [Rhizoctonia solani AG-1 IB]